MGVKRDVEQCVPFRLLDDLELLELLPPVKGVGHLVPGLVHCRVGVLTVVLGPTGGLDVLSGDDLTGARPGIKSDLVVAIHEILLEEVRRRGIHHVEAGILAGGLDGLDGFRAPLVAGFVSEPNFDGSLNAAFCHQLLGLLDVDRVVPTIVGR